MAGHSACVGADVETSATPAVSLAPEGPDQPAGQERERTKVSPADTKKKSSQRSLKDICKSKYKRQAPKNTSDEEDNEEKRVREDETEDEPDIMQT